MANAAAVLRLASTLVLSGVGCSSPATEPAGTSTVELGFDDVVTTLWTAVMPAGYGGLSWENFYVVDSRYPPYFNTGYRIGTVSPPYAAYNGSMEPATIQSPSSMDLVQAYFTSAYAQTDEPYQVRIEAYRGSILKFTRVVSVVTSGPTLAQLDLVDIDKVVFTSLLNPADQRRSQFVMDNLKVRLRRSP